MVECFTCAEGAIAPQLIVEYQDDFSQPVTSDAIDNTAETNDTLFIGDDRDTVIAEDNIFG